MSLIPLHEALALTERQYALAGFVCLGYEDARAYVAAAEAEKTPAILMVGPGARGAMPIKIWGAMLSEMAEAASVPLVVHLDHGRGVEEARAAIEAGFSSVMFDGSRLPFAENVALTKDITKIAHQAGVSCEGEIGFVGYDEGETSNGTAPEEAIAFAEETGVDAMAVSVGNVHLQKHAKAEIDIERLEQIRAGTNTALVIHGGSGVPREIRAELAHSGLVSKFNIGTEMRQVFGASLRESLSQTESFDRLEIMKGIQEPMVTAARRVIRNLKGEI